MRWRLGLLVVLALLAGSCLAKARPKLPPICTPDVPEVFYPRCRLLAEGEK